MTSEPLHIFDPRRTFALQGFTGRAATTTLHDATETGVSISGIFQAAEDFAVLGLWNAYDYYAHLRLKHLPRTDLSGLKLEFDIEYDHSLDGAMRLDAAKFASVSWDAMCFECGVGGQENIHQVRLLDHAAAIGGGEMPATVRIEMTGEEPAAGLDWLHLHFRDTRYTIAHADCRFETQLQGAIAPGMVTFAVDDASGLQAGDTIWIERTGANEEQTTLLAVAGNTITAQVALTHADRSFVTRTTGARHVAPKLAERINTPGESAPGRYGPDQTAIIEASASGDALILAFKTAPLPAPRYGKLGNLDRVLVTHGHTDGGSQGVAWAAPGAHPFSGGDNDTQYRTSLDFTQPLIDKLGRVVPMHDCRKIYMVFAPRFELTEAELEEGCFLASAVGASDTVWHVDDTSKLTSGRYFIGTPDDEERVRLVSIDSPTQITIERGYQGSVPGSWAAGTRMKRLSPVSGFASDVEWRATISNIAVTGDATLKVGGDSERIEENDKRCTYSGFWEPYSYGDTSWPTQWWSAGHAKRCGPSSPGDSRSVTIRYSYPRQHDLYLGTFLYTSCGKISVSVDGGAPTVHDLYLNEFGGTTANIKLREAVPAGSHTVTMTALFDRNPASGGYYFYFDYLWPLEPQDRPDPPRTYSDVSLAIDFDTDHGYKKPPAWHVWQLQKLGFKGHADVYMGVFWNNKRRRVGATYPYATIQFSGEPAPGDVVSLSLSGTTINHAIGYGETLQQVASHMRAAINGMFSGVWADDNFGSDTTLRIQSKAPSWTFPSIAVNEPNSVTMTLADHLDQPGLEGDWEMIDSVSPVMTEGARMWIRDLAREFKAAGIDASFAFSMECYVPPPAMRARYLHYENGVVSPGSEVFLPIPSHHMHFGARVRNYLKQMYKECADELAAAGLPIVLQFGETQWWYFDNIGDSIHGDIDPLGGMPFYDEETIDQFRARYGRDPWPFRRNTDDPAGDPARLFETADFLRDRIWEYCEAVISYVRQYHPSAVFECLWPLDANQGAPKPNEKHRALNMHVNLPNEWKTSAHGIKYFRSEAFDYDVWQRNLTLVKQAILYPRTLGRPADECMFLSGIYGPPDPPMMQSYAAWKQARLYSFCFWAFDQFCLNSRPINLDAFMRQMLATATYHKPRAPRAAVPV